MAGRGKTPAQLTAAQKEIWKSLAELAAKRRQK